MVAEAAISGSLRAAPRTATPAVPTLRVGFINGMPYQSARAQVPRSRGAGAVLVRGPGVHRARSRRGGLHRDRSARRVRRPAADDLPHPQRRAEGRACPAPHRRQPHRPRSGRRARTPPGRRGRTRRHRSARGGVVARPRRSRRQRVLPAQAPPPPTLTAPAQTIDAAATPQPPNKLISVGHRGGRLMAWFDLPESELWSYRTSTPEPEGLDAWWADRLREAEAVATPVTIDRHEPDVYGPTPVWDIAFSGARGDRIRG